jgi:hypothetical protein
MATKPTTVPSPPVVEVALAAVFLLLIPVNVSVAREVNDIARSKPRLELLVLVSRLVLVLAITACVFGLFSALAVFRFLTGTVLLPQPITALIFVAMAVTLSAANLLVRRYLRAARR